jgi:hypothetical protein
MAAHGLARGLTDPCGKFLPALLYHDMRDRLRGRRERAAARWGAMRRPDAPGKLVWIAAGATRSSVRLAVELARAILARRLDLALTLSFEAEYPDVLARLEPSPRIACSHAPADYAGAMDAVWRRLLPFGVILAGMAPRENLVRLSEACRHSLLLAAPVPVHGRFERIYPSHEAAPDSGQAAPAADFEALMPASSASDDPRIASIRGGRDAFLWHGDDAERAKRLFALFRGHLPDALLLVGGDAAARLSRHAAETVALGAWNGQPIAPEKLVLIDDAMLLPTLASQAAAVHFERVEAAALWPALAAGAALSAVDPDRIRTPSARAASQPIGDENDLISLWSRTQAPDASAARQAARAAFAAERARAQQAFGDMLARIGAWR